MQIIANYMLIVHIVFRLFKWAELLIFCNHSTSYIIIYVMNTLHLVNSKIVHHYLYINESQ